MRTINLQEPKIEGDWNAKRLDTNDYQTLIETEEVEVFSPEGELICVVLRNCIDMDIIKKAWPIVRKINLTTNNRGSASGEHGETVKSGIIGYYPRYPRIPYCRQCAWNAEHPAKFQALQPLFEAVDSLHREYAPTSYFLQKAMATKTSKDFLIPNTIYTTVTVNKNFRCASHLDAKNFYEGMAPMLLLRQGQFSGGFVVLPEWNIAVKLNTNDLILFRNMKDYHGNTPIVPLTSNYQRCTLVFYYREDMFKCGTAAQELERAKSGENYAVNFNEQVEQ